MQQQTVHTTTAPGRFSRRAMGLLFAGLLQAGVIWALVAGLDVKVILDTFRPPIDVTIQPKTVVKPPEPAATERLPEQVYMPEPTVVYQEPPAGGGTALTPTTTTPGPVAAIGDHGPVSVMATHTIPPYPPLQIRLGIEGTVQLRVLIGPDGAVTGAQIVRSSGDEALDEAARRWVIQHWRYKPAIRGGVAVPSAVNVAVQFSLKNKG